LGLPRRFEREVLGLFLRVGLGLARFAPIHGGVEPTWPRSARWRWFRRGRPWQNGSSCHA